jgi:uncharacterized protein (DUF1501 family)
MFTIWGKQQGFCDGVNRRNFLKIGAFGAGLTLADMLRLRASASPGTPTPSRNKAAIMIYLPGGPSHMDMYDLKPDAPVEFRGEFQPIQTNVPGVQICEHFQMQARMWDKLACIRSIVSVDEHSDSLVMTGKSQRDNMTANHPSFGSVVSRVRAGHDSDMPAFVSLRGMARGTEPGFLGISHRPFSPSGPGVENLRPLANMTAERMSNRRQMLDAFDNIQRDLDASINGLDSFTARAFDMISSGGVRNALDLTREPANIRQRYRGVDQFLTARRLVEAGVGCVTLSIGGWDTHGQNFQQLRRQLPEVDRGVANLVQDLHDRGLLDDVAIVMWGEFGRTPRVNNNAGRDHWAPVMSALVAGGGLRMGQAIGASTARGERPQDRRYTVPQVLSTLYRAMGIDPATTFTNGAGRPVHIVDDREPVRELV